MASTTEKKPFFIWSCILHVSILLALILELSFSGAGHANSASSAIKNQNIIHAVAVNSDVIKQYEQAEVQKKLAQQQAVQKIQELLKKQQQEEQAQIQAEAQKQAAEKLAAEKLVEQKQAAEKLAEQKLADQKLAEQKAVELKQSIQKQLAAEIKASNIKADNIKPSNSKPNNINSNNLSSGIMDKYKALIIQAISQQWVVPENLPKNINCVLLIRVAPGGVVLDVNVEKSSGNLILDNSAIAAVKKASPLPVPMEANNFESFRIIKLMVKPDGSLLEG